MVWSQTHTIVISSDPKCLIETCVYQKGGEPPCVSLTHVTDKETESKRGKGEIAHTLIVGSRLGVKVIIFKTLKTRIIQTWNLHMWKLHLVPSWENQQDSKVDLHMC